MQISRSLLQLPVQVELNEVMQRDGIGRSRIRGRERNDVLLRASAMRRPVFGIGRFKLIAQKAEYGIRREPMLVLGEEGFVLGAAKGRGFLRRKNLFQKGELGSHHGFVI